MREPHHADDPPGVGRILAVLGWAVHVLVVGLALLIVIRACLEVSEAGWTVAAVATLAGTLAFVACYALGARATGTRHRIVWVALLVALWLCLLPLSPDALFLAFPLSFIVLHERPGVDGVVWVAGLTAAAVVVPGILTGWSLGGVIGPVLGASVAVVIASAVAAFTRQARERDQLIAELTEARDRLATAEREAGALAERARIGRDLHDTVAQALSSIQLLLHAAERTGLDGSALADVRLARSTAADALAESRRFIAGLRADASDGLEAALVRLAADASAASRIPVRAHVSGRPGDPDELDDAIAGELLRIAQGAVANAVRHSGASRVDVTVSFLGDAVALDVVDDGSGFDPGSAGGYGLQSMRERASAIGGSISVESGDQGTAVAVAVPWRRP